MPLADFNVTGQILAETNVDDVMDEVSNSLRRASKRMNEAGDDANNFSADLLGMAGAMEPAEEQLEQMNDELSEMSAKSAAATSALASLEATSISSLAPVGGLRDQEIGPDFFRGGEFQNLVAEQLDIDKQSMGGISGRITQGSTETLQDLTQELQRASRSTSKYTDVTRALSRASKIAEGNLNSLRSTSEEYTGSHQRTLDGISSLIAGTAAQSAALKSAEEAWDDYEDEVSKTDRSLKSLSLSVLAGQTSLTGLILSTEAAEESIEDLDRDVDDLRRSVLSAAPSFKNLSANVGPFNISLDNLATTIPILLGLIGALIALLSALIGAIVAVTAAFASFMALGAVEFLNSVEENMAGVNSRAEAMEEVFGALQDAISLAVEPLRGTTIGGLGPSDAFVQLIQDAVLAVHLLAEGFAEILEMREVESFLLTMRRIFFGIGEEEGFNNLLDATKDSLKTMLPYIEDFFRFVIEGLPSFIRWATSVSDEMIPTLADFGQHLIFATVHLSHFIANVLDVVLPVLGDLVYIIGVIAIALSALSDALGPVGDGILTTIGLTVIFIAITAKLIRVLSTVYDAIRFIIAVHAWYQTTTVASIGLTNALSASFGALKVAVAEAKIAVWGLTASLTALQTLTIVGLIITLGAAIIWVATNMQKTVNIISNIVDWFNNLHPAIKAIVGVLLGQFIVSMLGLREVLKFIMDPSATMTNWWKDIQNGIQGIADALDGMFGGLITWFNTVMGGIIDTIKWISKKISQITGSNGPGEGPGITDRIINSIWTIGTSHKSTVGPNIDRALSNRNQGGGSGSGAVSNMAGSTVNIYTNVLDDRTMHMIERRIGGN